MNQYINVEVAYALPQGQTLIALQVPEGSTALQAVTASGVLARHPELDPTSLKLGIFSRAVRPDVVLRDKDRVEIYRPLLADPKQARRNRAEETKATRKG